MFSELARFLNADVDHSKKIPKFTCPCPVDNCSGTLTAKDFGDTTALICSAVCSRKSIESAIGRLQARSDPAEPSRGRASEGAAPHRSLAEPHFNGHNNSEPANGNEVHRPEVNLESWKLSLLHFINSDIEAGIKAGVRREVLIDDLMLMMRRGVENVPMLRGPSLSATDLEDELLSVATNAIDALMVPAATNGRVPTIVDPYAERQAIDAFAAYEKMKADNRDYSVAGLIRDGCTMVIAALIGSGKTTLAMNFARAWGLGLPTFGRACRQSRTLVVVSPKEYEAWAETIGFWQIKGLIFLVESTKAHFPNHEQTVRWFNYLMRKHDCRTFVLDTLFDFFGMPPNTSGDPNRTVMNEQTPFLSCVREQNYSGIVTGHAPKSEAYAVAARDPEEAFGGHTAWTAQHRMRASIRRKSQGVNAFLTGRGGYGDEGILKEEILLFDKDTRLVSLGGPFSEYLGTTALPIVIEALRAEGWASRADLEKATGKGKSFLKAGLREGLRADRQGGPVVKKSGAGPSTKYALTREPDEQASLVK